MKMMDIAAVVVTYNRINLLLECLDAILNQTHPVKKIILIDNASTDQTPQVLKEKGYLDHEKIHYVRMETNTGGSGGFYEGLRLASQDAYDGVWIMDDDTIPEADALFQLVSASEKAPDASFFASCVKGMQNEPMNVPELDIRRTENGYPDWYMQLEQSMVKIQFATFVSLLISHAAIQKCGLPCKDYFIWGDDTEYTLRLTKHYGAAYLVGNSWVIHKRQNAKAIAIANEDAPGRVKNYYYFYRNNIVNSYIYHGRKGYTKQMLLFCFDSLCVLSKKNGFLKFRTIQKGMWAGITQKKKFRGYIQSQLKRDDA